MAKQHIVVAHAIVAKLKSDTGEGYFYRDAVLPDGVPAKEKERLVDMGLVKVVDDEDVPDQTDTDRGGVGVDERAGEQVDIDKLKLAEARELADKRGVDIAGLTKVDDIRDALKKASAK